MVLFQQALDRFIVPFYKQRGASFSPKLDAPDFYIYECAEKIKGLTKKIYLLTRVVISPADNQTLNTLVNDLRELYIAFCCYLTKFYNEVERNNVPIYATWGEGEYLKLEQKLSTFLLAHHRDVSMLVTAAIYHGWGYDFKGHIRPVDCIEESPWCNEKTREEAMANISYSLQLFSEYFIGRWTDRWQRLKAMINYVSSGDDSLRQTPLFVFFSFTCGASIC